MKVLTKALIRESEENAVKSGIFSFRELMYRAGAAAAGIIMQRYGCAGKKVTVVCGSGNNGGDGCVIAGILSEHGAEVTVITPFGAPVTENAGYYYERLPLVKKSENPDFESSDIIIDALFGIGLNRRLDNTAVSLINKINGSPAVKIAVDIPSGVEADSGRILGAAVDADLTVTFIALKPGLLLPDGSDFCGEISVADIGVEPVGAIAETTEKPFFKKRRHNSHKGTFGTALTVTGSYGMAGAAILAARAALRSGAGILKCLICESIYPVFTASVPEAVCIPAPEISAGTLRFDPHLINKAMAGSSAVLIGCGLGVSEDTRKITEYIAETSGIPMVIDADGINALCGRIDIIRKSKAPVILTPHPGEMARLCSCTVREVESDRINTARSFALKYGCTLVLKGANTVIAAPDGRIFFNLTGNPGMSTGGSGDVLAGIVVSLLAQGTETVNAACSAVYLHGEAGDRAASKRGERAMLPSDMIEEL